MKLLAIETSTDACSVALMIGNQVLSDHRVEKQKHGALLLPMVDALMAQAGIRAAELDALVYGCGPGSFTGVRIGVASAQGIALGADIGVVGISTLQSIAQGCYREYKEEGVAVSVDARMNEVYFCQYVLDEHKLMQAVVDEQLLSPHALEAMGVSCWAGTGAKQYEHMIVGETGTPGIRIHGDQLPSALDHLTLAKPAVLAGELQPAELASPVYLRNKVALTTAERKVSS